MSRKKEFHATAKKSITLSEELRDLEKATIELGKRLNAYYKKGGKNSDLLALSGSEISGIVMREGDDRRGWQGNRLSDINPATGCPYGRD